MHMTTHAIAEPITDFYTAVVMGADWFTRFDAQLFSTLFDVLQRGKETGGASMNVKFSEVYKDLQVRLFILLQQAEKDGSIMETRVNDREVGPPEKVTIARPFSEFMAEAQEFLIVSLLIAQEVDRLENKSVKSDNAVEELAMSYAATDDLPALRLSLLANAFNALQSDSVAKLTVFTTYVKYMGEYGVSPVPRSLLDSEFVHEGLMSWPEATPGDLVTAYKVLYTSLKKRGHAKEAFQILMKGLQDFSEADDSIWAVSAVTDCISLPSEFGFQKLMSLSVVQQLQKGEHSDLFNLASIFYSGTLDELRQLEKSEVFFAKYGLKYQDVLSKMKLTAAASATACVGCTTSKADLSSFAEQLNMSQEELEEVCVSAAGHGIMSCKIDQLDKTLTVGFGLIRNFGRDEWQLLAKQLSVWQSETAMLTS